MQWGDIRARMVERMAEYQAGVAEVAGAATLAEATLYARISTAYRKMLRTIASKQAWKVTTLATFTYANGLESVTLPAAVKYRDIFSLERQVDATSWEPISNLTDWQEQMARSDAEWVAISDVPVDTTYGFRQELDQVYVYPRPTADLTIRARYFAAVTTLTAGDSVSSPVIIPEEFHDLIATVAARSILGETRSNRELENEFMAEWDAFTTWAAQSPKKGPRFVAERD